MPFLRGLPLPAGVSDASIPDPYTPPDGTFNITGNLTVSGTLAATPLTTGSVIFAGASGVLSQDNSNFFWDDTNNRLGIGIGAPTATLHTVQPVITTGSPTAFTLTGGAHTTLAASTEAIDVWLDLARTVQFAQGALGLQRTVFIDAPTYAFATGASTLTTAVTVDISAAPAAGANATITNTYALRVGGAVAAGASAAGSLYAAIRVPAHTVTYTGTTGITSAGPAAVSLGSMIVTDTSAVTIDTAATLYIAGAPVAAGSVTLTSPYSIWVDAGASRFDGAVGIGAASPVSYLYVQAPTENQSQVRVDSPSGAVQTILGSLDASGYIGTMSNHEIGIRTNNVVRLTISASGNLTFTQGVVAAGSPTAFTLTGAAHTTLAASTEAIDINLNLARTVQFATGALTTQRAVDISAPTYGFVGASTITTAVTVDIAEAPAAGTNATITADYALRVGGAVTAGPTSAGALYAAINVPAHTVTYTGTTQVTSAGPAAVSLGIVTVTDTSTVTINTGATLYIAGAPASAGLVTITNAYSLWVDAGDVRTDGQILAANGTISAPSYSFQSETGTGWYAASSTDIRLALGGTDFVRIESSLIAIYTTSMICTTLRPGNIAGVGADTDLQMVSGRAFVLAGSVQTSGSAANSFVITAAAHTGLTASTEVVDVNFNLGRTVQHATGALTTQRAFVVQAPTYAFVGASTLTTAVTVDISGAPAAGTSATITNTYALRVGGAVAAGASAAGSLYAAINVPAHTVTYTGTTQVTSAGPAAVSLGIVTVTDTSAVTIDTGATLYIAGAPVAAGSVTLTSPYSIWVDAGASRFDGAVGIGAASPGPYLYVTAPAENQSYIRVDDPTVVVQCILGANGSQGFAGTLSNHEFAFRTNNTARLTFSAGGNFTFTQGVATSGSPTAFTLTGAAHTTLAASTEAIDVNLNLARTVQFATGALTAQRAFVVQAPTYAFVGASTATSAVTMDINAAPTAGTNATFTNASALTVGGSVTIGPAVAGQHYGAIVIPSHTVTVTGTTQVTGTGPAMISIAALTITDTSVVTIDNAAALYIAAAPVAAGSVTITNAYSLWVDAGNVRTDGQILAANGTISAPSYSFQSETGTGWYAASSTDIRLALGGTDFVRIESSLIAIYTTSMICTTLRPGNIAGVGADTDLQMVSGRAFVLAGSVQTSGSAANSFVITAAAHTGLTASTEVVDVNFNLARTVQHATGALTTQRAFVVQAPTYAFVGASTLTTAVTVDISGAPAAGTSATITNTYALRVGGAVAVGASAAGSLYAAINVPAHTVTYTGTTQVTSAGPAAVSLGIVTVTDTSAVTIDTGATLYIAGAPAQAGSVTITNAYAIWVDAGAVRFDGTVAATAATGYDSVDAAALIIGATTATGVRVGKSGGNVGFYAATPVARAATIVDADGTLADITTKFNTLLVACENIGILLTA